MTSDSKHFVRMVTEMGDRQPVVASRDIHSQTGIKLVAEGTHINSSFMERLIRHKLVLPIEQSLAAQNSVVVESMAEDACRIVEESPHLQRMRSAFTEETELRDAFSRIYINTPMAFKLTVAREQRPEFYRHSLVMTLISLYAGHRVGLNARELSSLGAAAALHDIGILHIDPALLDRTKQLTDAEWRHIHSHPVIGHLILSHYPEYEGTVARAALEHHERLDGSGYPKGLAGDQISRFGQILAISEIAASRFDDHGRCEACEQMEVIIKLNAQKFDAKLMEAMLTIFKPDPGAASSPDFGRVLKIQQQVGRLVEVFSEWENLIGPDRQKWESSPMAPLADYVRGRMFDLRQALYDAGFSQGDIHLMTQGIENDPQALAELDTLTTEALWQTRSIVREIRRRWPEYLESSDVLAGLIREWEAQVEQTLSRKPADLEAA